MGNYKNSVLNKNRQYYISFDFAIFYVVGYLDYKHPMSTLRSYVAGRANYPRLHGENKHFGTAAMTSAEHV
jgi:hypothetical protein